MTVAQRHLGAAGGQGQTGNWMEERLSIPGTKVWGLCVSEVALEGRLFGTTYSLRGSV